MTTPTMDAITPLRARRVIEDFKLECVGFTPDEGASVEGSYKSFRVELYFEQCFPGEE